MLLSFIPALNGQGNTKNLNDLQHIDAHTTNNLNDWTNFLCIFCCTWFYKLKSATQGCLAETLLPGSKNIYDISKAGFVLYTSHNNSPNNVLAQANHLRLNFVASSL